MSAGAVDREFVYIQILGVKDLDVGVENLDVGAKNCHLRVDKS